MDLPPAMLATPVAFAPRFSDRPCFKAQTPAIGAPLATGPRTVYAVLRVLGLGHERLVTNHLRVLNRDAWSGLAAGQVLLGLIVALIPRDWPIVLAADGTIERRSGPASGPRAATAIPCGRHAGTSSRASG